MIKDYQIIEQSAENILSSHKIDPINLSQLKRSIYRYYYDSYTSQLDKIYNYLHKWIVLLLLFLSSFSFYNTLTVPSLGAYKEYRESCLISQNENCNTSFQYKDWESVDAEYRDQWFRKWIPYTNIIIILLAILYLPYRSFQIYKLYKLGYCWLLWGLWRFSKLVALVLILPAMSWWLWAFFWSIVLYIYSNIAPIPYELFGTFDIPWQL